MPECITALVPVLATLTALFTAGCAVASFWLTNRIYREAKTDERLIFGPLAHPSATVSNPAHYNAVIGCAVFNKSHRKAFIENVVAFNESENRVEITWSDSIDQLGNPGEPRALIGIVDSYVVDTLNILFFNVFLFPLEFRKRLGSDRSPNSRARSAPSCRIRPESVTFLDPRFAGPEHGHRTNLAMFISTHPA